MRKATVVLWLGALTLGIIALFWHVEWVYSLPTPVPKSYQHVRTGQHLTISSLPSSNNSRPVLLHFFNPDCPCSKFNIAHFKTLVKMYGKEVDFIIVPMTSKPHTVKEMQQLFQVNVPVIFDSSIAAKCGVYSTPQAVIINIDRTLYYRGNYNKSRYCTNKQSNYVMMALDSLLHQKLHPVFNEYALKAYGCEIPRINHTINLNEN